MKLLARVVNNLRHQDIKRSENKTTATALHEQNTKPTAETVDYAIYKIEQEVAKTKKIVETIDAMKNQKERYAKQLKLKTKSWNTLFIMEDKKDLFEVQFYPSLFKTHFHMKVSMEQLLCIIKPLEVTDVRLRCTKETLIKMIRSMPTEWFGKQRNVSIKISRKKVNISTELEVSFLKAVIAVYHSMRQNNSHRPGEKGTYYRELMETQYSSFHLKGLPSRYFRVRSLTVYCDGMVIPKTLAMKAILSCNFDNESIATAIPDHWDTMKKIVQLEADKVEESGDGTKVIYYLNGKKNTIKKLMPSGKRMNLLGCCSPYNIYSFIVHRT